jgi:hypothetical protein
MVNSITPRLSLSTLIRLSNWKQDPLISLGKEHVVYNSSSNNLMHQQSMQKSTSFSQISMIKQVANTFILKGINGTEMCLSVRDKLGPREQASSPKKGRFQLKCL